MDMYMGGAFAGDAAFSYGGPIRSQYRDFEQFPYGTLESSKSMHTKDPYSKVQEKCKQIQAEKSMRKQCPFCKEHKKRPLINYMRKRESRKHHESICEDEEEEEEEEQHQQQHDHEHGHNNEA